jgi:hypothetical protein
VASIGVATLSYLNLLAAPPQGQSLPAKKKGL